MCTTIIISIMFILILGLIGMILYLTTKNDAFPNMLSPHPPAQVRPPPKGVGTPKTEHFYSLHEE